MKNEIIFLLFALLMVISCKKKLINCPQIGLLFLKHSVQRKWRFFTLKSGKHQYKIPHSKLPYQNYVTISLVGYITELGAEENHWRF